MNTVVILIIVIITIIIIILIGIVIVIVSGSLPSRSKMVQTQPHLSGPTWYQDLQKLAPENVASQ
jgi:flagellar basal body-associated protein FliL